MKWALKSITTNKDNGGDGIPAELFQVLKDDDVKVLHSITCTAGAPLPVFPENWLAAAPQFCGGSSPPCA